MIKRLIIEFGGLCMFVQRDHEPGKGLQILMPRMDHPGMVHCQMLLVKDGTPLLAPIGGHDVDLRRLAVHGMKEEHMPKEFARISVYAGGLPVDERWLGNDAVGDCLAARVRLPLGSKVHVKKNYARGRVREPHAPGAKRHLVGLAEVTVHVKDSEQTKPLVIAGHKLVPDTNHEVHVQLLNIPYSHLDGQQRRHRVNEPMHHPQAYYSLLRNECAHPSEWPPLIVDEDQDGKPQDVDNSCPTKTTEPPRTLKSSDGRFEVRFIDPYNCTIGTDDDGG